MLHLILPEVSDRKIHLGLGCSASSQRRCSGTTGWCSLLRDPHRRSPCTRGTLLHLEIWDILYRYRISILRYSHAPFRDCVQAHARQSVKEEVTTLETGTAPSNYYYWDFSLRQFSLGAVFAEVDLRFRLVLGNTYATRFFGPYRLHLSLGRSSLKRWICLY